jgi:type II secretory pathway component PulF
MKFYIDYMTSDGDLTHVWVDAQNKEDAEQQARSEYWDIDQIIDVRKAK